MATMEAPTRKRETLDEAVIRFCGDSGDGMQLAGTQFSNTAALLGNDIATFPDFPAEIRAPRGTKAGVSGFQVRFASKEIFTPGDQLDDVDERLVVRDELRRPVDQLGLGRAAMPSEVRLLGSVAQEVTRSRRECRAKQAELQGHGV